MILRSFNKKTFQIIWGDELMDGSETAMFWYDPIAFYQVCRGYDLRGNKEEEYANASPVDSN